VNGVQRWLQINLSPAQRFTWTGQNLLLELYSAGGERTASTAGILSVVWFPQ
jgi:hypothetical protein